MRESRNTFRQAGEQQMTEPDNFEESTVVPEGPVPVFWAPFGDL